MSGEAKLGFWVIGCMTLLLCCVMGTCSYQKHVDLQAPIVETCVKHPSTRPPWQGGGNVR